MTRRRPCLSTLRGDPGAVAAIEFALLAPMFFLFVMGALDFCYQTYSQAVLHGAVEEAGRLATIEEFSQKYEDLNDVVRDKVWGMNRDAKLSFARQSYRDFKDVGIAEEFNDDNGNGVRDAGECFEDANGNGGWDADQGTTGNGGADDVVLYTVSMRYERLMPFWKFIGQPSTKVLTAQTILRNQPFGDQDKTRQVICA